MICAHSMGARVAHYFLLWVTESDYGKKKGGKAWLDKHVHSFMPIGGPMLGASSGTEQFFQPGNCSGLAPAVVNYTDGIYLIIYLSVHLSIYLFKYPSIYLYTYMYMYISR